MTDRRLIEDYLPIREISAEASREKSIRHGHISTLHLWWARRPLVACRAAIFGALVPAPETPEKRKALAQEMIELCKWKVSDQAIQRARQRILEANGGEPPKVLDMFAGGGSIPLETLRLGCEAYALELNPVAHLIELCTLVYPQKYGPDLAKDVEKWGKWILKRVKAEIGDLYPPIRDRETGGQGDKETEEARQYGLFGEAGHPLTVSPPHPLVPVAYLWTRTVRCSNPACGATVPLYRQTWLCKKKGRYIALKVTPDRTVGATRSGRLQVRFSVVQSSAAKEKQAIATFGFDPASGSSRGHTACPFCGSTVKSDYVKAEGQAGRIGTQPMAVVCTRKGERGKVYLAPDDLPSPTSSPKLGGTEGGRGGAGGGGWPDNDAIRARIQRLCAETGLTVPEEPITSDAKGSAWCIQYGLTRFGDLFAPRQLLALLTFVKHVRAAHETMLAQGMDPERAKAVATYLGLWVDRLAEYSTSLCSWNSTPEAIRTTYARQALPMVWDFAEVNLFGDASGNALGTLGWISHVTADSASLGASAYVHRGSAMQVPFPLQQFDAIITDPPYYDNVAYSDLSDLFYVWLKRTVGHLYLEHFAGELTPRKQEAVADATRHDGDRGAARAAYEAMMLESFQQANKVLKPGAPVVVVYAHKTTVGWSTLVRALRRAGFIVTEAWPVDTERKARVRATGTASLASSIFLVARRREGDFVGDYVQDVRPQLTEIVRERVETLMAEGIGGADLVIAAVGAGLRAYTQYAHVELASGEELDASAYLEEVQREVAEVVLEKVMGVDRRGVGGVDPRTRYYVLGRYQYGIAQVPFDEANVLARGVGVELDAPHGLTWGSNPLVEKKKDKVRLRDYRSRGEDEDLGLPCNGARAPLVDVLHRLLWLAEHAPLEVPQFLVQARPDAAQLRLVAQALAGRALAAEPTPGAMRNTRTPEQGAIDRLLAAWKRVVEENLFVR